MVRIASDPVFGDIQDTPLSKGGIKGTSQVKPQFKRNSFATHVSITDKCNADARKSDRVQRELTPSTKTNPISCQYCERGHTLDRCLQFEWKAHRKKLNFLKAKGLCFSCLCMGHLSKNCDRRIICRQCTQTHPSLLHIEKKRKEYPWRY